MNASDLRRQPLIGDITHEEFFRSYWRKRPLFVKNGARQILGDQINEHVFDDAARRFKESGVSGIKERDGEVTFIERISEKMPNLLQLANHYARVFGVPVAWFDAVRTYSPSGIGSHFDHSDNFVLQQTGVKHWALSEPGTLSQNDLARRMLNLPGVGAALVQTDRSLNFVLEPGDLLYLPLFWIHSGVSLGPSVSVSLVCPAISFQSLLLRGLQQAMIEQLIGHQPVPACPSIYSPSEIDEYSETLEKVTRNLLVKISSDNFISRIVDRQHRSLRGPDSFPADVVG